jgi:hypothetical protein
MPAKWTYEPCPLAFAPGLESTQGLGLNIRDYVYEIRQEDSGWTTVKRQSRSKQRKTRRL